jgi:hypothetical protein
MDNSAQNLFYNVWEKIIDYLPNLFAGIVLVGVGWLLGWLIKRVVVQLCVLLRVDRLLGRFRWGENFSKGDVRFAFFNWIGNFSFFIVFLIFIHAALTSMQLVVLSNLIEGSVLFIPHLVIALLIAGLGWMIAGWVAVAVKKALAKEEIPRATLIARFLKSVILLFFSAMALTELDIAREIVVIGFAAAMITLGALTIILTSIGGKPLVKKMLAGLEEK